MGIYALGRLELAGLFPQEEEAVRRQLIEAKIFLQYKKDLSNLSLQEARLRRHKEKDEAKLKELQDLRHQQQKARLDQAAKLYIQAVHQGASQWDPQPLGSEFSMEQIEMRSLEIEPNLTCGVGLLSGSRASARCAEAPNQESGD